MGYQYKFDIAGTEYGMSDVESAKIEHPLFDKFSAGNTCSAELDITIWQKSDIPKMAKIVPFIREVFPASISVQFSVDSIQPGTYSVEITDYGTYDIEFLDGMENLGRVKITIFPNKAVWATYEAWDWFDTGYLEPETMPITAAPNNTFPNLFSFTCLCGEKTDDCAKGNCPDNPVSVIASAESAAGEWKQLGVFWIDTREKVGDRLHILAYDAMMRGNVVWEPDEALTFPMPMNQAAQVICDLMGVELDERAKEILQLFSNHIDYPANGWTLRDCLGFIGAAYGANWTITAEGKLLLVPLFPEAFDVSLQVDDDVLLSTEDGEAITLGGVSITV